MNLIQGDNISVEKWNELIHKSSFSSPFQSFEFYSFFKSVPNYNAEVFAIESNKEILALVVITFHEEKGIKSLFSKRAIIYGGPLITDSSNSKNAIDLLFLEINKKLKNKVIYGEIRNFNDYSIYKNNSDVSVVDA